MDVPAKRARLVGCEAFVRVNPHSDRFVVKSFHHLELCCGDAKTTASKLCAALGFRPLAHTNMLTGNSQYASYAVTSGSVILVCTASYGAQPAAQAPSKPSPNPSFNPADAHAKFALHGLHVSAVGLHVNDATHAYARAVAGGATSLVLPHTDKQTGVTSAEVVLYQGGDTALRFVSDGTVRLDELPFLPGYVADKASSLPGYGISRMDHVVGNVPDLLAAVDYLVGMSGFHEFAEFTAADVGTVDSGLNSMVLASNNESVLLPINEPTSGGRRKSQIATYLEQNGGPGVQHVALKTNDIFATVSSMRAAHELHVGFELMERPREEYYAQLEQRLGGESSSGISAEMAARCKELGILADRDDQGVLLQVFTKPIGDRSTLFVEIIQRIGCTTDEATKTTIDQTPGCGGFGKGNFHELFRAIEEYETRAGINKVTA